MEFKFNKEDLGKRICIIYDLEKLPKRKVEKGKIDPLTVAIGLGAEMIDYGRILDVTDEYLEIKRESPLERTDSNPDLKRLDDYFLRKGNRRIPYFLIKSYEFLL